MSLEYTFGPYTPANRTACLDLLAANTPAFFAPSERADYAAFLAEAPPSYQVLTQGEQVVGAAGLVAVGENTARIQWILLDPSAHGKGLGSHLMRRLLTKAQTARVETVHIAASQRSAPFFAHYGARVEQTTPGGWGPGLDRLDMVLSVQRAG